MGTAIVSLKLMPKSPDTDLDVIRNEAIGMIDEFTGLEAEKKIEEVPIAFGLKSLNIIFVMKEETGSTEPLEKKLAEIPGVNSVEVTDVRRALG
ncbi:elongation factor 1-beta [Candidatus Woesearchaeota archaeon]|nr:elongation factor 1-beta [Candidatus Woesearchaeota archaeon]